MKNYLKATIAFSSVLTLSMLFASCGKKEIPMYETKHECGNYTIATFEDIENFSLPAHTPVETVAENFTDFCYYKYEDNSTTTYAAHIPVDMSQFLESEVIINLTDDNGNEKSGSFSDYIESQKTYAQENDHEYEDIGDGSHAELYIYFNADKEISYWELYPNIYITSYTIFLETLGKNFTFFSDDTEFVTHSIELSDDEIFDWPFLEGNVHFIHPHGDIGFHTAQIDHDEKKETFYKNNYIFYFSES
ncbi:MAG: hypothetical protein K2O42_09195 [Oscillospiraceae bacterium]|nr:hypothetical protein [Oscillospiraceae bacterium]